MISILCVVGTRPEAIKMAPVISTLQKEPWVKVRVLVTAQHRELLDQVLQRFGIVPDIDLNIMRPGQNLAVLTAKLIEKVAEVLEREQPDLVLSQGDTTTVFSVALAAFYHGICFGHVEAGLRTFDHKNPFPEEMNRELVGRMARFNFCPTSLSAENLRQEGIPESRIHVTGNTVIDTLRQVSEDLDFAHPDLQPDKRLILVTAHRRENIGSPFRNIFHAIDILTCSNPDIQVLYPVHPNPNVAEVAREAFSGNDSVILCEPLDYFDFIGAMKRSWLILTDSGGVQEEAPALGKPVLVLRSKTERPEAVEAGTVKVVGTETDAIVAAAEHLLSDNEAYNKMARSISPYGDGHASRRIADIIRGAYQTN
jgi:UDP-N-acetylglucosamine 2-epimerase (non-hydrolysing)